MLPLGCSTQAEIKRANDRQNDRQAVRELYDVPPEINVGHGGQGELIILKQLKVIEKRLEVIEGKLK